MQTLCAQRQHHRDLSGAFQPFYSSGDSPTRLYLDLTVSNVAGNVTACTDQQPFADDKFTLEATTHIGVVSRSIPAENACLSDNHVLAFRQRCCDRALDDQAVARGNFAGKGHSWPYDHGPAIYPIVTRRNVPWHFVLLASSVPGWP